MNREKSDIFYQNVEWFNEFFSDLKRLFDKISTILEEEFEFDNKSYYYYKPNDRPRIPSGYFLLLGKEDFIGLQMVLIFKKDEILNPKLSTELSILIIYHDCENHKDEWIAWNIINNENIKQITEDNGYISGILDWETEIKFHAFQVPLDLFLEYRDETVKNEIVSRINEIMEIRNK